jgi:hypothetical protein
MLVERVFLVSGVVKTVICRFKKKENFFVFHDEQKKVKQDFVVISKSPLSPTLTPRTCSITSWLYFFFRKKRREKILSVSIEQVLYFFPFRKKRREKILRVSIELVLYFFYWREKILCVIWREYSTITY